MRYLKVLIVVRTSVCGRGHLHEAGKSCHRCSTKVPLRRCLRKHKIRSDRRHSKWLR